MKLALYHSTAKVKETPVKLFPSRLKKLVRFSAPHDDRDL